MDPPPEKRADAARLRKDGFRAEIYQGEVDPPHAGGVAAVTELASSAQAADYLAFTFGVISHKGPLSGVTSGVQFVRFAVPNLPGAKGTAQISRSQKQSSANVQWVEGDCVLELGDQVPGTRPDTAPLVKAAQAIDRRTAGHCPVAT
jgi:hypothetical protein